MKSLIIALVAVLSASAQASTTPVQVVLNSINQQVATHAPLMDWKVGDSISLNLSIASFISGTNVVAVKSITDTDLVITQDIDLGSFGKQSCEATMDPNTGKTKKITCNGQDQQVPDDGDMEVVSIKNESVTVPAGTFNCSHIKVHLKSENQDMDQWANPKLIPVTGMIKSVSQSQIGEVDMELASYKKN